MVHSGQSGRRRVGRTLLVLVLSLGILQPLSVTQAGASPAQPNFQNQIVFNGLTQPTNLEFAPSAGDDRVFVAEKAGVIKMFDNLGDASPTIVADLKEQVHAHWDRGLIGLAIAPSFPATPYVYVLYTYGVPLGGGTPRDDNCTGVTPTTTSGKCVVSARLSRLTLNARSEMTSEKVLITDWCQQFPSHSIGDLKFGQDGYLYVSAGDGASFMLSDYGQLPEAGPINPCGDAPGGATMTPPTAEGGALRSQDLRTTGDPTSLDGTILRLDPNSDQGAAAPGNPLIASPDLNARRIVANGLRNPYHFTFRPGTNEVWAGDVGNLNWEEINRIVDPTAGVTNFGWPCYEGQDRFPGFDNIDLSLCEDLYADGVHTRPYYSYHHSDELGLGAGCPVGTESISGLAFHPASGGSYPAKFRGALFFADYSRRCIWAMKPSTVGGLPAPGSIELFAQEVPATDLSFGPDGELYYLDYTGGTVRRFRYYLGNQPPVAHIGASTTSGGSPLTVEFDGTGSYDADPADGSGLDYAWDFDNNGTVDTTDPTPSFTYLSEGDYTAKLTVKDTLEAVGSATIQIHVGEDLPTAVIDLPAGITWAVGQEITFAGHATDPDQGALSLTWRLRIRHCNAELACHTHDDLGQWAGVSGGSFRAPDHEYPSYLELELDAEDIDGNHSVVVRRLYPKTVDLTFVSTRAGALLTVGGVTEATPFTRTVIQGGSVSVSAPLSQVVRTTRTVTTIKFVKWSDGLPRTHVIVVPTAPKSFTASYASVQARRLPTWGAASPTVTGLRGRIPVRLGIQ